MFAKMRAKMVANYQAQEGMCSQKAAIYEKCLARGTENIEKLLKQNDYFTNVLTSNQIHDVAKKVTQKDVLAPLLLSSEQLFSLVQLLSTPMHG